MVNDKQPSTVRTQFASPPPLIVLLQVPAQFHSKVCSFPLTATMVNSQPPRLAEKSGDLILRLRDTSRTEYLSESTLQLMSGLLVSHLASS